MLLHTRPNRGSEAVPRLQKSEAMTATTDEGDI